MSSIDDEDRTSTPTVPEAVLNKALEENDPLTPQDKLELLRAEGKILGVMIDNLTTEAATGKKRGERSGVEMGQLLGRDVRTMTIDELNEEIERLAKHNAELKIFYDPLRVKAKEEEKRAALMMKSLQEEMTRSKGLGKKK